MQSYLATIRGPRYTFSHTGNRSSIEEKGYNRLDVVNGLIIGDKKAPNPIAFTKLVARYGQGTELDQFDMPIYTNRYTNTVGIVDGAIPNNILGTPDWARVHDRCQEKIYEKLRAQNNLIVDALEGGQTIRMVRNVLRVKTLFRTFVKDVVTQKNFRSIRHRRPETQNQKRLDYVTGKWLEYRYGWLPLVKSTYEVLETLNGALKDRSVPFTARSGYNDTKNVMNNLPLGGNQVHRETLMAQGSVRQQTVYTFKLPMNLQAYDFTSLSPLGIAWELLPLSFVADWFFTVGKTLSLWENYVLFARHFQHGYVTRGYRQQTQRYYERTQVSTSRAVYVKAYATRVDTHKERSVLKSLPMPQQGVRVKVRLNAEKLLDAASLLQVFIGRKSRTF